MARFIQPQFFEPEQLTAIGGLLDRMAISDDEGRRVFIIALEYELAEYEKQRAEQPADEMPATVASEPETAADPGLADLAESANGLLEQLQVLPPASADTLRARLQEGDPYRRRYPEQYLPALAQELERLVDACTDAAPTTGASPSAPTLGGADRRFVLAVAEAFEECFETDPAADDGAALLRILQQVVESCRLPLRLDQSLLRELLQDRGGA